MQRVVGKLHALDVHVYRVAVHAGLVGQAVQQLGRPLGHGFGRDVAGRGQRQRRIRQAHGAFHRGLHRGLEVKVASFVVGLPRPAGRSGNLR
ncbi:hypothetical protein G6F22_021447 [Rhizopus arrhizus]|nr:hypothetical protein G6F22_021447 [Rhizopus arrhizus]